MSDCRYIRTFVDIYANGDDKEPVTINNDIVSMTITESTGISVDQPVGGVVSNELSFDMYDINNDFSLINPDSIYKDTITKPIKCVVYLLVEVSEDVYEKVPMGTYFTTNINNNSYDRTTSVLAYDRLYYLFSNKCRPILQLQNSKSPLTVYELFRQSLTDAGLVDGIDFVIDSNLNIRVAQVYLGPTDLKERLKTMCLSFGCLAYVDRYNVIRVVSQLLLTRTATEFTEDNQIINASVSPSYTDAYSGVNIKYPLLTESTEQSEFTMDAVVTSATGINNVSIDFTEPICKITSIQVLGGKYTTVDAYDITTAGVKILLNNYQSQETVTVKVKGVKLETNYSNYNLTNDVMLQHIGERMLEITSCAYVSDSFIQSYADSMLKICSDISPVTELEIRGYPILEPVDSFTVVTEQFIMSTTEYIPIDTVYTLGAGLSAKLKGITSAARTQYEYVFVTPSIPIKVEKYI